MLLNDYRRLVDKVDKELVQLLNKRAQMINQIAQMKREAGLPLRDDGRETQIHTNALRNNPGPLDAEAIQDLFRCILDEMDRVALNHL